MSSSPSISADGVTFPSGGPSSPAPLTIGVLPDRDAWATHRVLWIRASLLRRAQGAALGAKSLCRRRQTASAPAAKRASSRARIIRKEIDFTMAYEQRDGVLNVG